MPAPTMSSQLERTSAILGEYMLKGWTLTDLHCDRCRTTPLMREPLAQAQREGRGPVQFCALCDGGPSGIGSGAGLAASGSRTSAGPSGGLVPAGQAGGAVEQGASTARPPPRQSQSQPDLDPAESISSLLLAGYTLLNENCPNASCRGIPLVGFPRSVNPTEGSGLEQGQGQVQGRARGQGGKGKAQRDSRRMCVSCGGRWADEEAVRNGEGGLRVVKDPQTGSAGSGGIGGGDERERRRREMYGLDEVSAGGPSGVNGGGQTWERVGDKERARAAGISADFEDEDEDYDLEDDLKGDSALSRTGMRSNETATVESLRPTHPNRITSSVSQLSRALESTSSALTSALSRLAQSLNTHTDGSAQSGQARSGEERYFVDLKLHTEAMRDVLDVLNKVRRYEVDEQA